MHTPHRYYFNALFDLELGGFPVGAVKRSAAEMTALFTPLMQSGDTILLDVELRETFHAYLREYGLAQGDQSERGGSVSDRSINVVWGWNREAVKRLAAEADAGLPPLDVVRQINNRLFCSSLARRHGLGVPCSRFCATMEEAESAFASSADGFPLVIKPAFGGAGFGLRVVRQPEHCSAERPLLANYLLHGGAVIEPWCTRTADLSTAVTINPDGSSGTIRYQRQWVNRYGAFFGIYCAENDPMIEPWKPELERSTLTAAKEAVSCGYFGPMGIDSFVYHDRHGKKCLAACIEINGRCTMGLVGQLLRERIAPRKHTLFRFIGKNKCTLPESYDLFRDCLGNRAFDRETGCGILLLSPLRVGYHGRWKQPRLSMFFLAGNSPDQIERLDRELRKQFAPDRP
ncbi:MAG: hypothetical protein JW913_10150 [Chitinispirillaceae bacterium]|nr:hypothetical protein [Chitinispirillaceae bacterium]